MTRAKGSFDFFNSELVVGTALSVERTYLGGQLASGEGVTLDWRFVSLVCRRHKHRSQLTFGGKMMGGGGRSRSET